MTTYGCVREASDNYVLLGFDYCLYSLYYVRTGTAVEVQCNVIV